MYWLTTVITSQAASRWEASHREPGTDSRQGWFAKELEILQAINPQWAERRAKEHEQLLKGLSPESPR